MANENVESGGKTEGPGSKPVGLIGIILIAMFVLAISLVTIYVIIQILTASNPGGDNAEPRSLKLLIWSFSVSKEIRLLLIVMLSGAVGAQVRSLRSLAWYVGNRALKWSWMLLYIFMPFVGAGLALIFYFVVCGGFIALGASSEQTSEYGFAGLSGLVGMFSEQAILKLKDVADTLLTKPKPGSDKKPQE